MLQRGFLPLWSTNDGNSLKLSFPLRYSFEHSGSFRAVGRAIGTALYIAAPVKGTAFAKQCSTNLEV